MQSKNNLYKYTNPLYLCLSLQNRFEMIVKYAKTGPMICPTNRV